MMYSLTLLLGSVLFQLATSSPVPQSGGSNSGATAPIDNEGGASGGNGNAYNLSTGGLVAIIVVVILAVVVGVATTTLFVIAKRRQETMRETMRRASRRLTGRSTGGRREQSRKYRSSIRAPRGAVTIQEESPSREGLVPGGRKTGRPGTLMGMSQLDKLRSGARETKEAPRPKVQAIPPPSTRK